MLLWRYASSNMICSTSTSITQFFQVPSYRWNTRYWLEAYTNKKGHSSQIQLGSVVKMFKFFSNFYYQFVFMKGINPENFGPFTFSTSIFRDIWNFEKKFAKFIKFVLFVFKTIFRVWNFEIGIKSDFRLLIVSNTTGKCNQST